MADIEGRGSTPGGPAELRVFAYAVAEKAELYVATVEVLMAARQRFRLQLRPAEIAADLRVVGVDVDADEATALLERLTEWGNVSHTYDGAAPETLAEFYGKRFLYQLTPAGTAAHDGVRAVRRTGLVAGGRLSGVLLPGIVERLEAIAFAAQADDGDGPRLYSLFVDLFGTFGELAENAARYMSDLAVQVGELSGDDARFVAYKQAVFAYLNDFVARFTETLPRIEALVASLHPLMVRLLATAASADVAPTLAGTDEGPRAELEQRWAGVYGWFVAERDRPAVAESLRVAMLEALNRILVAVSRLNERHLRRASREADFVQLARWFTSGTGETDGDAHLLWDHAFGLWGARHFSLPAGDEEVDRRRSFWDVEPAETAPLLRARGQRTSPGRPGHAADYRAAKLARVAAVRRLHAQAAAAVQRLAGRTPARLSDLRRLDPYEFGELLSLFDAALATPPAADGARTAITPTVRVVLRPIPASPAMAELQTAAGTLRCPDHLLFIDVGDVRREEAIG